MNSSASTSVEPNSQVLGEGWPMYSDDSAKKRGKKKQNSKNKGEHMTQGLIPEMIQKVLGLRNLQEQQYLWNNHKMF